MIALLLVVTGLAMGLGYVFKRWALFILAGLTAVGSGIIQVSTYAQATSGWLFGWTLMALGIFCFVESFIVQSKVVNQSQIDQKRLDREFPPERKLTEEEAYSQELDREITGVRRATELREAKALRKKYGEMMNR